MSDKPRMGSKDAKLAVIEYSDFQCPFCDRYTKNTFPRIKENYIDTEKVQYVARDFPLSFHRQAKSAAIAANCAGYQGKYWEMHGMLFKHRNDLKRDLYAKKGNVSFYYIVGARAHVTY